ncbi:hypothetical protein PHLCEN_2v11716 [Hermanssonia centrifuga]|uniref:Uncharacterized protein n=1 Tax=Hermanssonia centrifuga TaxID=98765 RepID=A0A2R6NJ58_9APHY|nr:hypothetical protein PHLCEN_2v11716 [Hermanssonia centrifuga]
MSNLRIKSTTLKETRDTPHATRKIICGEIDLVPTLNTAFKNIRFSMSICYKFDSGIACYNEYNGKASPLFCRPDNLTRHPPEPAPKE